jgi:hypothetical protein
MGLYRACLLAPARDGRRLVSVDALASLSRLKSVRRDSRASIAARSNQPQPAQRSDRRAQPSRKISLASPGHARRHQEIDGKQPPDGAAC